MSMTHIVELALSLPKATPILFSPVPKIGSLWLLSGSPSQTKKLITICSEVNPPKSTALVNFPLNEPYLSIVFEYNSSSISPVSEFFILSKTSLAISQRAFEGINSFTFSFPLRYSIVSK